MIPSLSRGRSRVRTAYICSSCLSHCRLPPSHPHSPPHTLNAITNHTRRAQAAFFSTSRAAYHEQPETANIRGTVDDGLGISVVQNEKTTSKVACGTKSKGEDISIDIPSIKNETRTPVDPKKESAGGKRGHRPSVWQSKIDALKTTFLAEVAGESITKVQPHAKAPPEDLKSTFLAQISQAAIESKVTPSTVKSQTSQDTPKTTIKPKSQKPTNFTTPPQFPKISKIPRSSRSWSVRTKQLQMSFLKEETPPTINTKQVLEDAVSKDISPEWLLKIDELKAGFLTAFPQPKFSTKEDATVPAVSEEKCDALQPQDKSIPVPLRRIGISDRVLTPGQVPELAALRVRRNKRRELRAQRAAKRKATGSPEGEPPDKELQEAVQDGFEASFESHVTAAISSAKAPTKARKARPAKLVQTVKTPSIKSLSIKEAMRRPLTRGVRTVSRPPRKKLSKDKSDSTPTDEIKIAKGMVGSIESITPKGLELVPINVPQPPVPALSYGLDRVLFNPGVYQLQDPRSRVFNFDPYLQTIMPVKEFDFSLLKKFITSSRDETLLQVTKTEEKKYTGSTSSMTAALSHFHYLLSNWRPIDVGVLSKKFPAPFETFTAFQRSPAALYLRWRDGVYAIDADKQYDTSNVLSMLGQSMEKLLTHSTEEYERYRKNSPDPVSEETRMESEAYHYTTMGDFLMRSQLDAHDPRIPGTGMFDLKTRAVISIRMDTAGYEEGNSYEIRSRHGEWESFEREYYDMIRSAFLKYSLQVRIGRMDGIFVAFHNTERIFGFQYISLPEMDAALHGTEDTTLGDSEFKLSLNLLNRVLDRATAKWPNQSLRLLCETRPHTSENQNPYMYIFAEPMAEEKIEALQSTNKAKIEAFEKEVLGLGKDTEEQTILEQSAEPDEIESNVVDEISEVKEARMVDQVDVVEDVEPSSSLAWDFDADESEESIEGNLNENAALKDAENTPNDAEESAPTIMAMYLTTRNKVNGESVQRPASLKPEDEWELEYSLAEIESHEKAQSLYSACKQRRNMTYNRDKDADDKNKWANSFREEIRRYTMKGKEYRAKLNAEQSGAHKVVYESGVGKGGGKGVSTGEDG